MKLTNLSVAITPGNDLPKHTLPSWAAFAVARDSVGEILSENSTHHTLDHLFSGRAPGRGLNH